MHVVTPQKPFKFETDYPQEADLIRVLPDEINSHPLYVKKTLNNLMRYRMPISNYEANLLLVRRDFKSVQRIADLWNVFYDTKLRVLVYRIPYFLSVIKRRWYLNNKGFHPLYWSESPKGFIDGTNYWADGTAILHASLLEGIEDFPRTSIPPDPGLTGSLVYHDLDPIGYLFLLDHPDFYEPAPVVEAVSLGGTVCFFDARYVDFLRSRWVFPGALINRVNGEPYLIFKKRRIIYDGETGNVVLGIRAMEITEEREKIWKVLSGDFWESMYLYRKRGLLCST